MFGVLGDLIVCQPATQTVQAGDPMPEPHTTDADGRPLLPGTTGSPFPCVCVPHARDVLPVSPVSRVAGVGVLVGVFTCCYPLFAPGLCNNLCSRTCSVARM